MDYWTLFQRIMVRFGLNKLYYCCCVHLYSARRFLSFAATCNVWHYSLLSSCSFFIDSYLLQGFYRSHSIDANSVYSISWSWLNKLTCGPQRISIWSSIFIRAQQSEHMPEFLVFNISPENTKSIEVVESNTRYKSSLQFL